MERTFICDEEFLQRPKYGRVEWFKSMKPTLAPWHTNDSDYFSEWYDDPDRYWGE
jgi:hypothetical protein